MTSLTIKIIAAIIVWSIVLGAFGYLAYIIFRKNDKGDSIWKEIIKRFKNLWK